MSTITASSSFQPEGQLLTYKLLGNQELQGIQYIELWKDTDPIYRNKIPPDQITIDNNEMNILYLLPINIGLTFNMMMLYGGMEQTDDMMSGYNVAVVTYQSSIIKMPSEYMQIFWTLNIETIS